MNTFNVLLPTIVILISGSYCWYRYCVELEQNKDDNTLQGLGDDNSYTTTTIGNNSVDYVYHSDIELSWIENLDDENDKNNDEMNNNNIERRRHRRRQLEAQSFQITSSLSSSCVDYNDWKDTTGENCEWYSKGYNCRLFGHYYANKEYNCYTANDACCVCGGGYHHYFRAIDKGDNNNNEEEKNCNSKSNNIRGGGGKGPQKLTTTTELTRTATGRSHQCVDKLKNWHDSNGSTYNCEWYSQYEVRCQLFGNHFSNNGYTANSACCACGGGDTIIKLVEQITREEEQ